jgi:prepilin-type N-terminal cleavage/methylation domain-containing protein/prepilin-type processing-associated H-X9-DG protein
MATYRYPHRRAFTLIELLTVIAIIGVLAAILIPTIGKVRENARATQCVANLRTWGNATNLYLADNKGKLPVSKFIQGATVDGTYYASLAQDVYFYVNRYVVAPTHPCYKWGYNHTQLADFTCTTRTDAGNNLTWGAYGFNGAASQMMLNSIPEPSRLVWATEAAGGSGGQRWIETGSLYPSATYLGGATIKPHGTKNNILYLDGHVASLAMKDVFKADFTRGTSFYNASDETVRMAN